MMKNVLGTSCKSFLENLFLCFLLKNVSTVKKDLQADFWLGKVIYSHPRGGSLCYQCLTEQSNKYKNKQMKNAELHLSKHRDMIIIIKTDTVVCVDVFVLYDEVERSFFRWNNSWQINHMAWHEPHFLSRRTSTVTNIESLCASLHVHVLYEGMLDNSQICF